MRRIFEITAKDEGLQFSFFVGKDSPVTSGGGEETLAGDYSKAI